MSSRPSRGAARLAAILDALPDALLLVNCNGTVVNANHIALETFEVPGTGLVGRGLLDLLPAFDSRRIPGSMRLPEDRTNGGRTKPTRMIARRTDGTQFPVEVTSANLPDSRTPYAEQGPYTGDELLMLVVRDLTGTLDTEAELARQQRQTEMILRAAAEGVVGVDTAGKVVLVNPSAAQILGYRASDLGGRELHPLIHHSRADGTPFPFEDSPIADTLRSGRKHRVRGQVLWAKDGRAVPVDLTTAPVRDGDQLVGAVMTFTDRRPYDALAARHAQLVAVLDGSLHGPLERLRGELGTLAADPAGQLWPEANQILHHLAAGYGRMARLVESVLAYQRLEEGEGRLERVATALDEVVAAGVEGAVELIGPGRAQFAVHAPAIEAEIDAEWFARALTHLIADVAGVDATGEAAAGAVPSGDSTIVVAAAKRDTAVRIEVRGPHPGGDPVHGPIVRGIVQRHGGVLQTHDVPGSGGGKAYVLEVPVSAEAGPVTPSDRPDSPPSIGSGTTIMPMPGQRSGETVAARGTAEAGGSSASAASAASTGVGGAGGPAGSPGSGGPAASGGVVGAEGARGSGNSGGAAGPSGSAGVAVPAAAVGNGGGAAGTGVTGGAGGATSGAPTAPHAPNSVARPIATPHQNQHQNQQEQPSHPAPRPHASPSSQPVAVAHPAYPVPQARQGSSPAGGAPVTGASGAPAQPGVPNAAVPLGPTPPAGDGPGGAAPHPGSVSGAPVPAQPTGRRRGPARPDEEEAADAERVRANRHGRGADQAPVPGAGLVPPQVAAPAQPTGRRARREAAAAEPAEPTGADTRRAAFALPPAEADRGPGQAAEAAAAPTGRRARRALTEAPERPIPGQADAEPDVPRAAFALPPAEADRKPAPGPGAEPVPGRPVPAQGGPLDGGPADGRPTDPAVAGHGGPGHGGAVDGAGGGGRPDAPTGPDGSVPLPAGQPGAPVTARPADAAGPMGLARPVGPAAPPAASGHSGPAEAGQAGAGPAGAGHAGAGAGAGTGSPGHAGHPGHPGHSAPVGRVGQTGPAGGPERVDRTDVGHPEAGRTAIPVGPVGPGGHHAPVGPTGPESSAGPAGQPGSPASSPAAPGVAGPAAPAGQDVPHARTDLDGPADVPPTGRRRARRALAEEPGATTLPGSGDVARAISVRTLGQGAPYAQQGGETPPGGTPSASGAGSGRRRKLGNPADNAGEREAQARAQAPTAPRPGPTGGPIGSGTGTGPGTDHPGPLGLRPPAAAQEGRAFAIGAPDEGAEGPEPLDGPNGAVEINPAVPVPPPVDDELPPEPLDNPRRLLVWPAPDTSTRQALTERGYRPVIVHSREEVDAQMAAYPAALFVDPLTGPITRTALQALRQAAVAAGVPVLVTAGLGQATREAAYGADPAVLLKALAPRDSEMHPARVLLVEEHEPIADALTATLERRGVQVACAATDAEAVALAGQIRPNLVVMDLMQVRRRRAGILDWLRAQGLLNRTPLVVYTSAGIDPAQLPRLASGETVLFLAERSTSAEVQSRIVDLLTKIGTSPG
ncbi:PAS domain-containing protein [Streptomyces sp. NPDC021100]|uniref:response regulator n=1 Tax=Streptomyces sp. NPDC021100 TaxID=3365114 RepID=UPI0037A6C1B8